MFDSRHLQQNKAVKQLVSIKEKMQSKLLKADN